MTLEDTSPRTAPAAPAGDRLSDIEGIVARARSGLLGEADALTQIKNLLSRDQGSDIYQKPWG